MADSAARAPAPIAEPDPERDVVALVAALQRFYRTEARDLPWRRTRDPYAIWVSEIMLQQTRVDTVVPRFHQFLAKFPTVAALAEAEAGAVCEAWAGLGYYRRARHLHQAARQLCATYGGRLPTTAEGLRGVVGIGPYTAGAIASIAFGEATPLVDGNVSRILARIYHESLPINAPEGVRRFWSLAGALVEVAAKTGTPGDFNQALMELGATVCLPRRPACGRCPVQIHCRAAALGLQEALPQKLKKATSQPLPIAFAYVTSRGGLLLRQRALDGLWAGLWELPSAHGPNAPAQLQARGYVLGEPLAEVRHLLTHRKVTATIYAARLPAGAERRTLMAYPIPLSAPLSTLARKAIVAARTAVLPPAA